MADYTVQTYADAVAIAQPDWQAKLIEILRAKDELTPMLPAVNYHGTQFEYYQEDTLGEDSADFSGSDDRLVHTVDTDLAKVDARYTKKTVKATRFGVYWATDDRIETELSNVFSSGALKSAKAVKRLLRAVSRRWWKGPRIATAENSFDNIDYYFDTLDAFDVHQREGNVGPSGLKQQTVEATPDAGLGVGFKLVDFDTARFRVKSSTGLTAWAVHPRTIVDMYHVYRGSAGGMTLMELNVPGMGNITTNVPQYAGLPLLQVDYIPVDEADAGYGSDTTKAYGFDIPCEYGLKTLHYGQPALRVFDLGRVKPERDEFYSQAILNQNYFVMDLQSMVRIDHIGERS